MTTPAPPISDLRERLIGRAMADDTFRQQLLAAPKEAVERALGISLPPSLEVVVVEETPSKLCLILPARSFAENELSDAKLSAIVGGTLRYVAGDGRHFVLNPETGAISFEDGASGRTPPESSPPISGTYRSGT